MHISIMDDEGDPLARDAVVVAFFSKRPYPKLAKAFGEVFEWWLGATPDDAKRWACIGANADEFKAFAPRLLSRARSEFDQVKAKTRDMCSLELRGPQEVNPDYEFLFVGTRDLEDDETNVIQLRYPSAEVDADHAERFVQMVKRLAEKLPYDSGYASPALMWGMDSQIYEFAQAAAKFAFRHPGFDMADNKASASNLGANKVRGAYWLTFLGPPLVEELGGEASLRKSVGRGVDIESAGSGLMLRAGKLPEVGDLNRGKKVPLLRSVAKVLEPMTLFNDQYIDNLFVDEDARARWERRHLD